MTRHPDIAPKDYAKAQLLTAAATLAAPFHATRLNRVVRPKRGEDSMYLPLRWRHTGEPAENTDWLTFSDHEDAGHTPCNYGRVALIHVNSRSFDELLQEYEYGVQAVAYRLGTTAMAGFSLDLLSMVPDGLRDEYAIAMRVGKGPLHASVGVYDRVDHTYYGLGLDAIHGVGLADPLESGVIKPISMAELPQDVQLV